MYIGLCHAQKIVDPKMRFCEVRYHNVLDPASPFDQLYHKFLFEKYNGPWMGYTEGQATLYQVFEGMARNHQYVCLTINSRTGKPGNFKIASPGSYVAAARCAVRAMEEFRLTGFIALFSEPGYRFAMNKDSVRSWLDPVYETIKMLNPKLQVGAPGEEWIHPNAEGIYEAVIKSRKIDILTVHTLTDSNQRLLHYKKIWPGPIAVLETGSQKSEYDYRTSAGAKKIEEIVSYVYGHRDRVICLGIVYGDSSNSQKANWTLRLWDHNYSKILNTTPAWNKFVQLVEKYSDRLPHVIKIPDWVPKDGRKIVYDPNLPILSGIGRITGKHSPKRAVTLTDLDWILEKALRDDHGIEIGIHYPRQDGSTDEQVRLRLEQLARNLKDLAK